MGIKGFIDKCKSFLGSKKFASEDLNSFNYGFKGPLFYIERDKKEYLGACCGSPTEFLWVINSEIVTAQQWVERYQQWTPKYRTTGMSVFFAAMFNVAEQDKNLLGALAVARVGAELGILDQMCQPHPLAERLPSPVSGVVTNKELLYMDPAEAFERFHLAE